MSRTRISLIAIAGFCVVSVLTGSCALAESQEVLGRMGYGGFKRVSPQKAHAVRGKGFVIGGDLYGQSVVAAGLIEYEKFSLAVSDKLDLKQEIEFEINLSDFRQQLGAEFSSIDLTSVNLRVKRVVDLSKDFNLGVTRTSLIGKDVVFGPSIRVIGGIFP